MSRRQLAGFLALCLIWGSTWAAIRIVVEHVPPLLSVSVRFLLASLVLLPVLLVRRPRMPKGREWGVISALSLVMIVLPFSLVAWAEQRISSGTTAILFATSPLFTAWMEPHLGNASERRRVPRATHYGFGYAQLQAHGDLILHLYAEARGRAQSTGVRNLQILIAISWRTMCGAERRTGTSSKLPGCGTISMRLQQV